MHAHNTQTAHNSKTRDIIRHFKSLMFFFFPPLHLLIKPLFTKKKIQHDTIHQFQVSEATASEWVDNRQAHFLLFCVCFTICEPFCFFLVLYSKGVHWSVLFEMKPEMLGTDKNTSFYFPQCLTFLQHLHILNKNKHWRVTLTVIAGFQRTRLMMTI